MNNAKILAKQYATMMTTVGVASGIYISYRDRLTMMQSIKLVSTLSITTPVLPFITGYMLYDSKKFEFLKGRESKSNQYSPRSSSKNDDTKTLNTSSKQHPITYTIVECELRVD